MPLSMKLTAQKGWILLEQEHQFGTGNTVG